MKEATRQKHRVPMKLNVRYVGIDHEHADEIINISSGGVFIQTQKPFPVGKSFRFSFELPDLKMPIEVSGTVTWAVLNRGMGIQFDQPSEELQGLIETYIDVEREVGSAFASLDFVIDAEEEASKRLLS